MKLGEARRVTSEHLNGLFQKKRELTKLLKDGQPPDVSGGSFDRVEISKALSAVELEYQQTSKVMERLSMLDTNLQNAEIARQQSEAMVEAAQEIMKILEVFRRISKGDQVPATDERKLMEYSPEMYMAAKNMALLNQRGEGEKHKSLWEEEAAEEESVDPAEFASNTEVGNPLSEAAVSSTTAEPYSGTA